MITKQTYVPLAYLMPLHFCDCPKPGSGFPTCVVFPFIFDELRGEGSVCFVDIEGIAEHHCFELFRKWLHDNHDFPYDDWVQGVIKALISDHKTNRELLGHFVISSPTPKFGSNWKLLIVTIKANKPTERYSLTDNWRPCILIQ